MEIPVLKKSEVKTLLDTRYMKAFELVYEDGTRYYDASRRGREDLLAMKSPEELKQELPDAVSCVLIVRLPGEEPKLVLFYEYRYPLGQYVLSIPAGLVDHPEDLDGQDPLTAAMIREIREETGILVKDTDRIFPANPALYISPGFMDESTALFCAVVDLPDLSSLSQAGAEGSERFGGFETVDRTRALELLRAGRDPYGRYYPLITNTALLYFVSDLWR